MTSYAASTYSEIIREFDALSSSSSSDLEEIPILDREVYEDYDLSSLPALTSSASLSSASSCFSFPSRSPHTGARWYDDHDFNPLSATSSISSPAAEHPRVSSEQFLHDTHLDNCASHYVDCDHTLSPPSRSASACSGASLSTSTLPPNPPPSLCGFPLDGMINNGITTTRLAISDKDIQKLQMHAWDTIGNGGDVNRSGTPERKWRLQSVRKAGGAVHKKLEKAMGEIFKR